MEHSAKTNRLAIISFVFGLTALLFIAIVFLFFNAIKTPNGIIGIIDAIIIPARNICVAVALITGVLALSEIKKKGGTRKREDICLGRYHYRCWLDDLWIADRCIICGR